MKSSSELMGLGLLSIGVNVTLMLVKVVAGVIGNSYALVADGIESASDIMTSLITWAGFQISLKPADENHPYGHGKIESLAGMFSGLSLLAAALFISVNSVREIVTPHHAPAWFTLPVLIAVVVTKEVLSRKVLCAGTAVGSQALKGDAWHHRSDAITSGAAALGITIALVGGEGYEMADDWAALLACLIIVRNGLSILSGSVHDVLDGSVEAGIVASVSRSALQVTGVDSVEKVRVRKSGIGMFADLHVRVRPSMTVFEGHAIDHAVKNRIMSDDPRMVDVFIHLEPTADAADSLPGAPEGRGPAPGGASAGARP